MFSAIGVRLGAMMFLQFFIWGAWYVTIGNYMAVEGMADLTHWPYTVNPIAAIIAPFFLGLVADRFFATEKVLGTLHIIGGLVMLAVPQATGSPLLFILLLLLYNLCYMPTLGLVNSLAFHHIDSQERQFPLIRVFGTIGWIVAGLFIGFVLGGFTGDELPDRTALPLYTAAIASLLLGEVELNLHTVKPLWRPAREDHHPRQSLKPALPRVRDHVCFVGCLFACFHVCFLVCLLVCLHVSYLFHRSYQR